MTNVTEALGRSRASLDQPVRVALKQGRTVRSRNRDGEYAILLTEDAAVTKVKQGQGITGIADDRADWTIAVPDFTLRNVAQAEANGEPHLDFFAPVLDRAGIRVGTIRVNGSPHGRTITSQGPVETATVFFPTLRAGDLFRESEADSAGRPLLFRATADADSTGRVLAEVATSGEQRVFDLGPDYLVFKVVR